MSTNNSKRNEYRYIEHTARTKKISICLNIKIKVKIMLLFVLTLQDANPSHFKPIYLFMSNYK